MYTRKCPASPESVVVCSKRLMNKLDGFTAILPKIKLLLFEVTLLALFVVAVYRVARYELAI